MNTEDLKEVRTYLAERKGRLIGAFVGLLTGLLWAFLGWWRAVIFLFCLALGYFIGYRVDHKDSWREIIEKVLPPTE